MTDNIDKDMRALAVNEAVEAVRIMRNDALKFLAHIDDAFDSITAAQELCGKTEKNDFMAHVVEYGIEAIYADVVKSYYKPFYEDEMMDYDVWKKHRLFTNNIPTWMSLDQFDALYDSRLRKLFEAEKREFAEAKDGE